jgi:hypothetical protein
VTERQVCKRVQLRVRNAGAEHLTDWTFGIGDAVPACGHDAAVGLRHARAHADVASAKGLPSLPERLEPLRIQTPPLLRSSLAILVEG